MSDLPEITDFELARLRDCEVSTRMGMDDQGFPDTMRKLAALNLVEASGKGHRVTQLGLSFLRDPQTKAQLAKL